MRNPEKKIKRRSRYSRIISCPICHSKTFEYFSSSESGWGTVEQHGYCHRCGYTVEQAYSPAYAAFDDIRRGYKHPERGYIPKDVKRHKRIRRKNKIKNIDINPLWIRYV